MAPDTHRTDRRSFFVAGAAAAGAAFLAACGAKSSSGSAVTVQWVPVSATGMSSSSADLRRIGVPVLVAGIVGTALSTLFWSAGRRDGLWVDARYPLRAVSVAGPPGSRAARVLAGRSARDVRAPSSLPATVEAYLLAHGWEVDPEMSSSEAGVYHLPWDPRSEILVPRSKDFVDYALRVGEVLQALAVAERRTAWEVLEDVGRNSHLDAHGRAFGRRRDVLHDGRQHADDVVAAGYVGHTCG